MKLNQLRTGILSTILAISFSTSFSSKESNVNESINTGSKVSPEKSLVSESDSQNSTPLSTTELHPLFKNDKETICLAYKNGLKSKWSNKLRLDPTEYVKEMFLNDWSYFSDYYAYGYIFPKFAVLQAYGKGSKNKLNNYSKDEKVKHIKKLISTPQPKKLSFDGNITLNNLNKYNNLKRPRFILIANEKQIQPIEKIKKIQYTKNVERVEKTITEPVTQTRTISKNINGKIVTSVVPGYSRYVPIQYNENFYQGTFSVDFPMFDENGKPYINKKTESITLKIIIGNREFSANYNLKKFNKELLNL